MGNSRLPKSLGTKHNFGHFRSSEQHASGTDLLSQGVTSYYCSMVALYLVGTVYEL